MPKIDPSQLLDCLDSLLGSEGGIKGETEVKRLAVLMTKFSKKLVSKCIYILILKSTEPDLLAKFMAEGGWALVFQWLDEGICNSNYPLIREILELLLICPISLDRLKENNCPKVVKGLSKDSESEEVKKLAGKLVEQWLKFIKSGQAAISDVAMAAASVAPPVSKPSIAVLPSNITVVSTVPLNSSLGPEIKKSTTAPRKVSPKPGIQIVGDVSSSDENEEVVPPIGTLPLYKITVRDGKSVFAKVGTKTLSLPVTKNVDGEIDSSAVILKSDPGSKNFRYVTKPISEKAKSETSEYMSDESSSRDKSDTHKLIGVSSESLPKQKIVLVDKRSEDSDSQDKQKSSKHSSSKSHKDSIKSKDSHDKVLKTSKEHGDHKSESKYKDKEKRPSKDSDKEKRKSEHKSHKTDKLRDREREKDKVKSKDSSKEKHKEGDKKQSKDKHGKDGKVPEKVLSAAEKAQIQADKDKSTLETLKTPTISLLGKIPKKSSSQISSSSSSAVASAPSKPSSESTEKKEPESVETSEGEEKKSSDLRTAKVRPKTVKTFNSKFRSTGLEEEIKPPPPRSSLKKKVEEKRPLVKIDLAPKAPIVPPKEGPPPEKKPKIADVPIEVKKDKPLEKPGGIKLINPKPKPTILESDMFSDALTASTKFEPRKRKRRTSSSKDGSEAKKELKEESGTSGLSEVTSPKDLKPTLKFYRDTLEESDEKNKENSSEVKVEPKTESENDDASKPSRESQSVGKLGSKLYPNGVLVCRTKKGPKKSVKWKEDSELAAVRYFELDETERVNVTRTFVDMKLMERSHEREAFQLARKLATEDIMEERIPWGPLYEVDVPPDRRSTVEPGKNSLEKNVQYAREKTVLQAIYFHRGSIPDSPAEPDPEIHPTTDPKIIPLDDITGNSDSVCNFQNIPWPEPKPTLMPSSPPHTQQMNPHQQMPHPQQMQHPQGFVGGYSTVGNFPGYPQMGMPGMMPPGQGNWRGTDGKDMGMNMPFQPNGPMCPTPMGQPPNMFTAGGPENFAMNGPPMGGFNPGYPMPCEPGMYGPPMGAMGMGGPPPPGQWNRGGGGWQGNRPFMGPMNPKFQKGMCHNFAKFGNCARGNSCRFMHPN